MKWNIHYPKSYGEYLVKLKYKGFNPFDISRYEVLSYYPEIGWEGVSPEVFVDKWAYVK